MLAMMRSEDLVPALCITSGLFLVLAVLFVTLCRTAESRLILLGLLTGVYSAWCGVATGSASVQAGPGAIEISAGGATGTLGRIAVLLVLGGIALALLNRRVPQTATNPTTPRQQEGAHADAT